LTIASIAITSGERFNKGKVTAMRLLHSLLALAVLISLSTLVDAAGSGAKGEGKKKHHAVHGVVVNVEKDKDKDTGTITVLVHHKKKGEPGKGEEEKKTFKVTAETKFEKVTREGKEKGEVKREPASFRDVHDGERVAIVAEGAEKNEAKLVEILGKSKKK
jgi:hypothetical protein